MTVRVYYLETEIVDGTEKVKGESIISRAILEKEEQQYKLIMDTSPEQDTALQALATSTRLAYPEEEAAYAKFLADFPEDAEQRDLAQEIDELQQRVSALEGQ